MPGPMWSPLLPVTRETLDALEGISTPTLTTQLFIHPGQSQERGALARHVPAERGDARGV